MIYILTSVRCLNYWITERAHLAAHVSAVPFRTYVHQQKAFKRLNGENEIKVNKVDDRSFDGVRIATMHRVKGLEFNYIFAVGVNNKALPNGVRSDFSDDVSLEEFETGEKCLLYVALTRARTGAYVTCYGTMSNLIV